MHGIVSRILFYVQTIQLGPMGILGAPSDEVGSEGAQAAGPNSTNCTNGKIRVFGLPRPQMVIIYFLCYVRLKLIVVDRFICWRHALS